MNYPKMTIRQLREICRMDEKYQGHWSCKTKSHLIDFMYYCDKALEWKTPARQQSQLSDSSDNNSVVTTGTPEEIASSMEPAPVQVEVRTEQTSTYIDKDSQPAAYVNDGEKPGKYPNTPPVHSARSVIPALRTLNRGNFDIPIKKLSLAGNQLDPLSKVTPLNFLNPKELVLTSPPVRNMDGLYQIQIIDPISTEPKFIHTGDLWKIPETMDRRLKREGDCSVCAGTGECLGLYLKNCSCGGDCPTLGECAGCLSEPMLESGEGDQHPGGGGRREPALLGGIN